MKTKASQVIEGYRLSPQQRRRWPVAGDGCGRVAGAVLIRGALDLETLTEALGNVIARHEALRTRFESIDGMEYPLQVVVPATGVECPQPVVTRFDGVTPRQAYRELTEQWPEVAQPMPALRYRLGALADDEHLLALALPGLNADLSSLSAIANALSREYAAVLEQRPLPAPEIDYLQYAEWINELDQAPQVDDLAEELRIGQQDAVADGRKSHTLELPQTLRAQAASLCARQGIDETTFWLTAWMALLHRYCGKRQMQIGFDLDGRVFDELRESIGPFAEIVDFALDIDGGDRFDEVLAGAAQRLRDLVEESSVQAPQDAQRNTARIRFQAIECAIESNAALEFSLHWPELQVRECKLMLSCLTERGQVSHLVIGYDSGSFATRSIAGLGAALIGLGEAALRSPETKIGRLALADDADNVAFKASLNATETSLPTRLVPEWLDESARRYTGPALIEAAGEISFSELADRSEALAVCLQSRGIGTDDRVGIAIPRSSSLVVAIMGVLKSGAAYVILDPDDPAKRLQHVMDDANPRLILGTQEFLDRPAFAGREGIAVDRQWQQIEAAAGQTRRRPVLDGDSLAYVLYTSGSTGVPKGVCVTHRGLLNYLRWACRYYDVDNGGGSLLHSAVSADMAVTTLFAAVLSGKPLRIMNSDADLDALTQALCDSRDLSFVKLTPSHLDAMAIEMQAGLATAQRALIVGGEALYAQQTMPWLSGNNALRVINEYGPTETVVGCCIYEADNSDLSTGAIPIGRPIDNTQMHVLDAAMRPVPLGMTGELYIGGAGVARGYNGRPGLTAARFVPDPFSVDPGARLYRTGDLGYLNGDGQLVFCGRGDDQVKIRGYRVEIGEIENVLRSQSGVHDCAVCLTPDTNGEQRLTAFLVMGRDRSQAGLGSLRAELADAMPDYMIPARFVVLDALPLNQAGKVDRTALAALEDDNADGAERYQAPRTFVEELLAAIWADVLGLDRVGIDDNFFVLGGDSIRSIRARALANKRGLVISNRDLFAHQSIRQLARHAHLGEADDAAAVATAPFELVSDEVRQACSTFAEDAFPLASLQAGMVFHSELRPDAAVYHDAHTFDLRLEFDEAALTQALAMVVARHPVLRSSFELTRFSEPLVVINREVELPLQIEDLRDVPEAERAERLEAWLEAEKRRQFDWSQAPLLRFAVHRLTDDTCRFGFSFHHAVLDGWSVGLVLTDLFSTYVALHNGVAALEPEVAVSFRDFVKLEQAAIEDPATAAFWREHLEDRAALPLPREQLPEQGIHVVDVAIPKTVSDGLRDISKALAVPIKTVLLAAHLRVLAHWTGQYDTVTGLVTNGRPESEGGDRIAGLFLNTVPFRVTVGNESWADLIMKVLQTEQAAIPNRRYPLALIKNDLGNAELFDSSFNFMHFHVYQALENLMDAELLNWDGYEETDLPLTANFALDLANGDVALALNCHRSAFSAGQVQRIAESYALTLAALAHDVSANCIEQDLLPGGERALVLQDWNATGVEYAQGGSTLPALIGAQAERTPEATALIDGERELSYAQLMRGADAMACELARCGVRPNDVVAVCAQRSLELATGLLAVLRAGATYLPLDPQLPDLRLEQMVSDSASVAVLADESLAARVGGWSLPVVSLQGDYTTASEWQAPVVSAGMGAYLIYTSGSTGVPKGVLIEHRGIVNRLLWMQAQFGLAADDRVLQKTPYGFDVSVWEFFWPLLSGATLVMARPGGHGDPQYLVEAVQRHAITTMHFVPSMLSAFLGTQPPRLSSLRRVICSGEALTVDQVQRFNASQGAPLHNLYGPTEASVDVSHWACPREGALETVPIGYPIANTQLYVLDAALQPLPVGAVGELYIGGVGLARCYHGRGALTASAFVPNPYGQPGTRLYRSGDRVRLRGDGAIEYLGRVDHQVKIRGFRIETGEIESVLVGHEEVGEAAVVAHEHAGRTVLVGYVAGTGDSEVLREHLRGRLPDYMVPAQLISLERLPLTANGKLNRRALPAPQWGSDSQSYQAPRDERERVLVEIWQDVLGLERVGIHDNYFELGGHSLTAIQIVTRIREAFEIDFPMQALFSAPTVAALALEVAAAGQRRELTILPRHARPVVQAREADGGSLDDLLDEIESLQDDELADELEQAASEETDVNPMTFDQERVWNLEKTNNGRFRYTVSFMFRLAGDLDVSALKKSLATIVGRHEVLRSTFEERDGKPVQIVHPSMAVDVETVDLSTLPIERRESALHEHGADQSRRPFDLQSGPLLRSALFRMDSSEHVLLVVMHALLMDDWSLGILLAELAACYEAYTQRRSPRLPELPIQVADYAHWERSYVAGNEQLENYWLEQLPGPLAPVQLPGRKDIAAPSDRGGIETLDLPADLEHRLREFSKRHGVTHFMLAIAGFKTLLHRYSGDQAICFGVGIAGRHRAEIEPLIGSFMNILLFRTDFDGDPSFAEVVQRVRETTVGAFSHQAMPWLELLRLLGEHARLGEHLPSRIMADHLNTAPGEQTVAGLTVTPVTPERQEHLTGSDLTFRLHEQPEKMTITVFYKTDLFARETIRTLLSDFEYLLREGLMQPDIPVSALLAVERRAAS